MQSLDQEGKVIQTMGVDMGRPQDLVRAIAIAQKKGAVEHVIAELPIEHEIVRIKGLKYEILSTDSASGRMIVELMKPEDQTDSHKERRHSRRKE